MKEETERKEEGRQFVLSDVPVKKTERKIFLRLQEKEKERSNTLRNLISIKKEM